jgi:hypothetical protein
LKKSKKTFKKVLTNAKAFDNIIFADAVKNKNSAAETHRKSGKEP